MDIVFIILFIIVIILIIIGLVYAVKGSPSVLSDVNLCVTNCENQFQSCLQACDDLGPDCSNDVRLACTITESICNRNCYPSIFSIRNGSVYFLYFYRSDGSLIGTLTGWSPDKLIVKESDFPITACVCDPNNCDCGDSRNGVVINGPGCYVVWFFASFYTTSEVCHTG